jgi:hypothetical protein
MGSHRASLRRNFVLFAALGLALALAIAQFPTYLNMLLP